MNFKIINIFLFTGILVSGISCKKFLDKKTATNVVTPTSLEDLQGLLDDAVNTMNSSLTPAKGESSADDYFLTKQGFDKTIATQQNDYLWGNEPYYFPNDWSRSYAPVYNANYCLEMLEKIDRTEINREAWDLVKGASLFHRAYNFLQLVWTFGHAYDSVRSDSEEGIVLKLDTDFNTPSKRASVSECYRKIIEDALASAFLLPDRPLHVYRPSRAAAYSLLARAYLSMRVYDSAYKYANAALLIKNDLMDYNNLPITNSKPFPLFNEEIIFYTELRTAGAPIGRGYVDTVLYDNYAITDLRRDGFFVAKDGYHAPKVTYATSGIFSGITTDELFLIRAECYARANQKEKALADLDALLIKRYKSGSFTPSVAADGQEALEIILLERRKELIFRGLRWIDIKRLNKEGANINLKRVIDGQEYILKANDDHFALPLPTDIIELTGMQQNP